MLDRFIVIFTLITISTSIHAVEPSYLPMYGGMDRSVNKELMQQDNLFIAKATQTFGTREFASQGYTERGFDLFIEDKLDKAMKRFNEAWLLDPDNPYVYLGYAVIQNKQQQFCAANNMFKIASNKGLSESGFLADYALTVTRCALTKSVKEKKTLFALSDNLYEQALQTPNKQLQAYAYHSRAKSCFLQNDISDAKLMVEKAREHGGKIDQVLLDALNENKQ